MPRRQRRQQPPLKNATSCFIAGTITLILAIVVPLVSVTCTNVSGIPFCIETTYYGLDAHTYGIVLGVVTVLLFAGGVYYLRRHKQALFAQKNGAVPTASQPMAPRQPGANPAVQQPGAYQFPQQQGAYPPVAQPGSYPGVQQPGAYPPIQQPASYPPIPQPGAYPWAENADYPGNYAGNGPYQPSSNTFPQR